MGEFKNDQVLNHYHNKGTMNIQGYFANVVTANGRVASGAFSETHWDSAHKFSDGGQWLLQAGDLNLNANANWTGLTSVPANSEGNGIGGSVNRGKREGVKYIIKVL